MDEVKPDQRLGRRRGRRHREPRAELRQLYVQRIFLSSPRVLFQPGQEMINHMPLIFSLH